MFLCQEMVPNRLDPFPIDTFSATDLLLAWGIAQTGRLTSARPKGFARDAGDEGLDFAAERALIIDKFFAVPDHERLRVLATHVYVHGFEPASYRWRGIGESKISALIRHGAGFLVERRDADIGVGLHDGLIARLEAWRTGGENGTIA
jgi:hypothetical protein